MGGLSLVENFTWPRNRTFRACRSGTAALFSTAFASSSDMSTLPFARFSDAAFGLPRAPEAS